MKKLTLTAVSTALCTLSLAAISIAPSFAQATKAPTAQKTTPAPAPTNTNTNTNPNTNSSSNPQAQAVEQLKLTKDQQAKLVKLKQSVMQKQIAVLNPSQKQQLQQGQNPSSTLTPEQKNQLKAIQSAAIAEQNKILTPEQQAKLQEMNKQNSAPQQR